MWFWLKFREAGGWLIASRIDTHVRAVGRVHGHGARTTSPDAAAASCGERAATGTHEYNSAGFTKLEPEPDNSTTDNQTYRTSAELRIDPLRHARHPSNSEGCGTEPWAVQGPVFLRRVGAFGRDGPTPADDNRRGLDLICTNRHRYSRFCGWTRPVATGTPIGSRGVAHRRLREPATCRTTVSED